MVKKTKLAKSRLDKYYNLAKEQGYRARSAYKLIQISKRYHIFKNCNTLVDLCAAPGGWLQVASNTMPINSLIIGVDLVPIKPINNVVTLQLDITTNHARQMIQKRLNGSKADVVLHDGSPNMGSNWNLDAFNQNKLVLSSISLASTFLRKGGAFVTKVFRSADYSSLIWVLQELFQIVKCTKPQSSRNVSAEIYVICMQYKNPPFIDPKLFDYKHIFSNRGLTPDDKVTKDNQGTKSLSLLLKLKKQNKRQGYSEGDDYRDMSIIEFLKSDNPSYILVNYNKIRFDGSEHSNLILNHSLTTKDILRSLDDLQVLGKKDLLILLKWRIKILKAIKEENILIPGVRMKPIDEVDINTDELEQIDKEIGEKLVESEINAKKLKKSAKNKQKQFLEAAKNKIPISRTDDPELFKAVGDADLLLNGADEGYYSSGDEENVENDTYIPFDPENGYKKIEKELEEDYVVQKERLKIKAEKAAKKQLRRELVRDANIKKMNEELERIQNQPITADSDSEDSEVEKWFKQDIYATDDLDDNDIDSHEISTAPDFTQRGFIETKANERGATETDFIEREANETGTNENKAFDNNASEPTTTAANATTDAPTDNIDRDQVQLLGPLLISKKSRLDLMDGLYNRYTYHEDADDLPVWFREDEESHTRVELPLNKEQMRMYRMKLKEIKSMPIRKVREALSRKMKRMQNKISKVRSDSEKILNNDDTSTFNQIKKNKKIIGKLAKDKRNKIYYVSSKIGCKAGAPNKKGDGIIKVVDKRMKKDNWKAKKKSKKHTRRGRRR